MDVLRIEGEVGRSCELSFEGLRALNEQVDDVSQRVPGRQGGAVMLSALLDQAGAKEGATHATLTSSDGAFSASVPLDDVKEALVLYRLGDEALPGDKGGPFRFLIPNPSECHSGGADACANVKYLASIKLTKGYEKDSREES